MVNNRYDIFNYNVGNFILIGIAFLSYMFYEDTFSLGAGIVLFASIIINALFVRGFYNG